MGGPLDPAGHDLRDGPALRRKGRDDLAVGRAEDDATGREADDEPVSGPALDLFTTDRRVEPVRQCPTQIDRLALERPGGDLDAVAFGSDHERDGTGCALNSVVNRFLRIARGPSESITYQDRSPPPVLRRRRTTADGAGRPRSTAGTPL